MSKNSVKRVIGFGQRATSADITCIALARCGFSYRLITERTGLSKRQITLRIKQSGSYIKYYRNGDTGIARAMIDNAEGVKDTLLNEIKQKLLKG